MTRIKVDSRSKLKAGLELDGASEFNKLCENLKSGPRRFFAFYEFSLLPCVSHLANLTTYAKTVRNRGGSDL